MNQYGRTARDQYEAARAEQASRAAQICRTCKGAGVEHTRPEQVVPIPISSPRWLRTANPYGVRLWFDWHAAVWGVFGIVGMIASVASFFLVVYLICHNLQK